MCGGECGAEFLAAGRGDEPRGCDSHGERAVVERDDGAADFDAAAGPAEGPGPDDGQRGTGAAIGGGWEAAVVCGDQIW